GFTFALVDRGLRLAVDVVKPAEAVHPLGDAAAPALGGVGKVATAAGVAVLVGVPDQRLKLTGLPLQRRDVPVGLLPDLLGLAEETVALANEHLDRVVGELCAERVLRADAELLFAGHSESFRGKGLVPSGRPGLCADARTGLYRVVKPGWLYRVKAEPPMA